MPLNDETIEEHESFGLLSFSRVSHGGGTSLFGSSIRHHNTIVVSVYQCDKHRHLHMDWYHAKVTPLIEVEMSPVQYSEAITAMNIGHGVPCTIRHVGGKRMESCPEVNQREQIDDEFTSDIRDLMQELDALDTEAKTLLSQSRLNKADRERLRGLLNSITQEVRSSIPFIKKQWTEAVEKTAVEAKGEIEAFFTHAILRLGQDELVKRGLPDVRRPELPGIYVEDDES